MSASRERLQVWPPVLMVSAAAWVLLAFQPMPAFCSISMMGSMGLHESMLTRNLLPSLAASWALMLVAMMLPLLVSPICYIRDHTFTHRRARSIAFFLAGYGAIWMLAGTALPTFAIVIQRFSLRSWMPLAVISAVAIIWQSSPLKQRCLNRNHAHSDLSAFGWAADLDAFRFGWRHGIWCFGSCWALMLLTMIVSRSHLTVMFAVTLWLFAERLERPTPPRWSRRGPSRAVRLIVAQTRMRLQRAGTAMP